MTREKNILYVNIVLYNTSGDAYLGDGGFIHLEEIASAYDTLVSTNVILKSGACITLNCSYKLFQKEYLDWLNGK